MNDFFKCIQLSLNALFPLILSSLFYLWLCRFFLLFSLKFFENLGVNWSFHFAWIKNFGRQLSHSNEIPSSSKYSYSNLHFQFLHKQKKTEEFSTTRKKINPLNSKCYIFSIGSKKSLLFSFQFFSFSFPFFHYFDKKNKLIYLL